MQVKESLSLENYLNNMSPEIINESYFLLYSIFSGVVITVVYDMIKIVRNVIPHDGFFIALEDICFWIFASLFLFSMLYKMNYGTVRWFAIAGSGLGMMAYKKLIGQYIVEIMSTAMNGLLHMVWKLADVLFLPIKWLVSIMLKSMKKIKKDIKKRLTDIIKKGKIQLCKHSESEKKGSGCKENESKPKNRFSRKKATE